VNVLRCAVYSRFSSDRQSPTSIADQIRKCREHAARQGWAVLEEHLYTDEAISGASTERAGLQRLLAAATSPAPPFDCILIDDTSRLSRRLADALNLYERLAFAGIRLVAVSQGVDSESAQAELLIGVHGLIDAVYWRELGQKTHRGMEGVALRGLATGGRCFGYRTVPMEGGGAQPSIVEAEADIVRRIFGLYASGHSLKRVARELNQEGVTAPQPQRGRISQSWCVSSVRHMLRNQRYAGKLIWNTKRKVRVPGTGRRVYRRRPESEWVVVDAPHLRVVSEELFQAVARRFDTVKKLWSRNGTRPGLAVGQQQRVYLFSGLLKCSVCGGSIVLVAGRAANARSKYGCAQHQRGASVCSNGLLIPREELEQRLLRGLQDAVLREDAIDYAVRRMAEELERRHAELNTDLDRLRWRKQEIEAELRRLVQAIAEGRASETVAQAIAERETELRSITDRLLEPGPGSFRAKLDELRTFAVSRLRNLRKLLARPESVHEARAALAEQVGKITLAPVFEAGRGTYVARGFVDFFGEDASRVGGAGRQDCTTRAVPFEIPMAA